MLFLATFLIATAAGAEEAPQEVERDFEAAGALYQKEDYVGAVRIYESLLSKGVVSHSLYYNLGNSYFKLENIGKAVLNYERALKLSPHDKECFHNLSFVRESLQDKVEPPESPRWLQGLKRLQQFFSLNVIVSLLCSSYTLLLLTASYAVVRPGFRPSFLRAFLAPLLAANFVFLVMGAVKIMEPRFSPAIVVLKELDVHYGPSVHETKAFLLHAGTKCSVREISGEWILIWLPNDRGGWVHQSGLERI